MNVSVKVKASLAVQSVMKEMERLSAELAGELEVVGKGQREVYWFRKLQAGYVLGHQEKTWLFGANKLFVSNK